MHSSTKNRAEVQADEPAKKQPDLTPSARRYLQRNPEMHSLVDQAIGEIWARLPEAELHLSMDRDEPQRVVVLEVRSAALTMDVFQSFLNPLRRDFNRRSLLKGGVLLITP